MSLGLCAQESPRFELLLKSGTVIPEKNILTGRPGEFDRTAQRFDGKTFAIIQFDQLPGESEKRMLLQAGIELLDYIPNNAYTVTINGNLRIDVLASTGARSIIEPTAMDKMQPQLAVGNFPSWTVAKAGTVDVWTSFPRTFSYQEIKPAILNRNIEIINTDLISYRVLSLRVPVSQLGELARLPFIEYVQLAPAPDKEFNYNSMYLSKANIMRASLSQGGQDILGRNVVIGIGDDGDPQSHIDYSGRLINRAGETLKAHSTHVTGTVGGAGLIQELYAGYAPKSTIISQVYSGIIRNAPTYVQDYGMVITNNSYGSVPNDCAFNGFYDLTAKVLDQQAFDLPELLHVFAAGNDGDKNCTPHTAGFKTVAGGYQTSKNILTVGSTDYKGTWSGFSSKGPVRDGRIKPDIMAQGQFLASTWTNNSYSYNNGTSMAAPGVSGGLALLVELYRKLHSNANPRNALLKALLCNGGLDRGNAGPDYTYGFGTMDLLRSSKMMEDETYFVSTATTGTNAVHTITVPANMAHLKVLLYWQDPPGSLLTNKSLVNDLDLQVTGPGGTRLPVRLDTTSANVGNIAGTGPDHHNNIEQVIINLPAPGTYDLRVLGHSVPVGASQEYFLVYDIIPQGLQLTNPIGGEGHVPTVSTLKIDTVYVQWDAYGTPVNPFTLEFFDGTSWSTLSNNIPASERVFSWAVPTNLATDAARMRISRNGTSLTHTSGPFTITALPFDSLTPLATQCEGYIQLGWRAVPGATDYEVFMLQGTDMVPVGTTTSLNYRFSGLNRDSTYWVAVRPRINGNPGRRAQAVSRQPTNGSCALTISDNDLKVDAILAPLNSGRIFTSTSLGSTVPITVRIKNLDNAASTGNITLTYSINGVLQQSVTLTGAAANITANPGTLTHTFTTTANLSVPGTYSIEVTAVKATDPVTANNSLTKQFKQLENPAFVLADFPWTDNFESASIQSVIVDQMGLTGRDRYDFINSTPFGRLRTFINSGIAYSGTKAITLDMDRYQVGGNVDSLTGTFNLSNFLVANDDIRVDFRYKNHGQKSNPANNIWIRGNDNATWLQVYDLFANQPDADGSYKLSSSIQLADTLIKYGQQFSSSFQVRWGQWGQYMAADNESAAGYTIDDIRLYRAIDDIQMVQIDTPIVIACGLNSTVPVKVVVRNTSGTVITNIPVFLRVDNVLVASEFIPTIPAKDTVHYIFNPGSANLSVPGNHQVEVWVDYGTDNVPENDTAKITVKSLPNINTYPYLENFESGDGNWYTVDGTKGTWEYGTPVSAKINRAASGSKAWKTNLYTYYDNNELSYLYSPCFDLTGLTNPTLSFSLALDIEDCGGTFCDGAWVEISTNGGTSWSRLGASGQGTNWYNKGYSGNNLWSAQDYTRWHVATIPLPTVNNSNIKFRVVFNSDLSLNKDGIAIDDIHIYDNPFGIYEGTGASPVVTQLGVSGTNWINFVETGSGRLIASILPNNQALGNTDVQSFVHTGTVRINSDQYYHNRNITIKPASINHGDSATVRFYFLDTEAEALLNATGCSYCFKPSTAYDLGVTKYSDADDTKENGTIADNTPGQYIFMNPDQVAIIPFDKGYYAEFKVKDFSEFWLNNGGFDHNTPLPVDLVSFTAKKKGSTTDVLVEWETSTENNVDHFEVELAKGNTALQQQGFVKIGELPAAGINGGGNKYVLTDSEIPKSGVRYYRLKTVDNDGSVSYSAIRPVIFQEEVVWQVSPNPSTGKFVLTFQAPEGTMLDTRVVDVNGRVVLQGRTRASGFVQKIDIDLQSGNLAAGLYLLEASNATNKQTFRLLKQ